MAKNIIFNIILIFLLLLSIDIFSQCATCKTALESDLNNSENSVAKGINNGILYLMAIPYILLITTVFIIYKFRRANKQEAKS
jgi:heme/copper-type cytochrome/quinol oxidase subunit 2